MEYGFAVLVITTFVAAFVNGALGYGFSSITVPIALLFFANRVLNPALVLIEVFVNIYALIINRASVPRIWKRVYPIVLGLLPGVIVGSYLVASIHPGWMKFVTYSVLLPLLLLQASGVRKPIRSEKLVGVPFGTGLGFLYSITTISGPPIALLLNNQGLVKSEFRAGLAIVRVAESLLTAIAYYNLGLFTAQSFSLVGYIVPGLLIGIPLGAYLIRNVDADVFRRVCISFDIAIVGFGLSRVLLDLKLEQGLAAYSPLLIATFVDSFLLYSFFKKRHRPAPAMAPACLLATPMQKPLLKMDTALENPRSK